MAGPQCCSSPPTLNPSSGAGHVEELGGLSTYVTGASESKLAVLLITDVFGYNSPILRNVADKIGAAGFFVVVPDFFKGEPYVRDPNRTVWAWLEDHAPEKSFDDGKAVVEALKSKGFSSIGAAGFCWGAKVVVDLSKVELLIQAAVLIHPSFVTVNDIKEVKAPISILGAEIDEISPPALLKQFEDVLSANPKVDDEFVKIYSKVSHGWSLRYDVEDEEAVKQADEAHKDILAWFIKYLN